MCNFSVGIYLSYSRVYLGVHFISDVVAGAISGIVIGILVYQFYILYIKRIAKGQNVCIYSQHRTKILTDTVITYVFLFTLFSDKIVILTNNILNK
nr:phosphatase PAP2 family protein [Dysgonomonas sp. GY617]